MAYKDTSLNFGFTDLSTDVQAIKDKGVNFVSTCMDVNGNINVGKALKQAGVNDVTIYSPEGYDPGIMKKFGKDLEGYRFGSAFVPFEAAKDSKGMTTFVKAMKKKGYLPNELELAGWIDADLLVTGIKASGKNFTRQSVIDNINKISSYTADGILAPVDWTIAHTGQSKDDCTAALEAKNGKFVPILGQPGKPFTCFPFPPPADLSAPVLQVEGGLAGPVATTGPAHGSRSRATSSAERGVEARRERARRRRQCVGRRRARSACTSRVVEVRNASSARGERVEREGGLLERDGLRARTARARARASRRVGSPQPRAVSARRRPRRRTRWSRSPRTARPACCRTRPRSRPVRARRRGHGRCPRTRRS